MQYKPLENVINYFIGLYRSAKDTAQKFGNSLMPSRLELALEGMPNPVLNRQPETPDKLKGYLFAEYIVTGYRREGRGVTVVVKGDKGSKTIRLDPQTNESIIEGYVRGTFINKGVIPTSSVVKKIAKLLGKKA